MKKSIWILGCVLLLLLLPSTALAAADDQNNDSYHDGDVAVVNNIIDNNGLQAAKDAPESWDFVVWDENEPKRIAALDLCRRNLSGTLDVSGLAQLVYLSCYKNQLTGLRVEDVPNLECLYCWKNQLKELKVKDLPKLRDMQCSGNQLTTLEAINLPKLQQFLCGDNQLKQIKTDGLDSLWSFSCGHNQLTELPELSDNVQQLDCFDNPLKALDLEKYPVLVSLDCTNCQLTELDLSGVPKLKFLYCSDNQLTVLDLSNQENLCEIEAENNPLAKGVLHGKELILQVESKNVIVDGMVYTTDAAPIMVNNRVMVPIRTVTEAFNGKAEWNETAQRVTLCFDDRAITMTIGSTRACVETTMEKDVELDVAPLIRDGRTYVPIRFVAEALDAQVQWSGEEKTILITK